MKTGKTLLAWSWTGGPGLITVRVANASVGLTQGERHEQDSNTQLTNEMFLLQTCSVHEAKKSTLKDFLERLKTIMKEKYSKC